MYKNEIKCLEKMGYEVSVYDDGWIHVRFVCDSFAFMARVTVYDMVKDFAVENIVYMINMEIVNDYRENNRR